MYIDDIICEFGKKGIEALCVVSIFFVSEYIEILEEIDMEYCELVEESGIKKWGRVFVLDIDLFFIDDLVDVVIEVLSYITRMSKIRVFVSGFNVFLVEVGEFFVFYDCVKFVIFVFDSFFCIILSMKCVD